MWFGRNAATRMGDLSDGVSRLCAYCVESGLFASGGITPKEALDVLASNTRHPPSILAQ
jgi:hypothetical protein